MILVKLFSVVGDIKKTRQSSMYLGSTSQFKKWNLVISTEPVEILNLFIKDIFLCE